MLRIRAAEAKNPVPRTTAVVVVLLVLALALSGAAVLQVFAEYALLGEWEKNPQGVTLAAIRELRRDVGLRIIVRSTASAVLLLCTVAMLWLQQRQLAILRVLHQVKRLALDILASMDQGVITTDLGKTITGINTATIQILGVGPECVGRPLPELSPAGAPLEELAGLVALRKAAVWDYDFDLDREGRVRRIRAHANVLKDAVGESVGCILLLRDVSDRILIEERVRWMERFLSLGNLASGLHHEIKNPLTALSIHVQLLEKRLSEPLPRKPVGELMGVLKSEIVRLNGVLDSFRDFASLQRLTPRPADLTAILQETADLIGPQADRYRVDVIVQKPEAGLPPVPLDVDKFKQALLNLVINALEAMPGGGKLVLGASTREGLMRVDVSDTGPGIAPEIQADLFRPYVSTKARGTGMGLALSEKVISQHGGRIGFRTSPRGTTFSIDLPMEPSPRPGGET